MQCFFQFFFYWAQWPYSKHLLWTHLINSVGFSHSGWVLLCIWYLWAQYHQITQHTRILLGIEPTSNIQGCLQWVRQYPKMVFLKISNVDKTFLKKISFFSTQKFQVSESPKFVHEAKCVVCSGGGSWHTSQQCKWMMVNLKPV